PCRARNRASSRSFFFFLRPPYIRLGSPTTTSCPSTCNSRDTHGECVPASRTTRHRSRPPKDSRSPPRRGTTRPPPTSRPPQATPPTSPPLSPTSRPTGSLATSPTTPPHLPPSPVHLAHLAHPIAKIQPHRYLGKQLRATSHRRPPAPGPSGPSTVNFPGERYSTLRRDRPEVGLLISTPREPDAPRL